MFDKQVTIKTVQGELPIFELVAAPPSQKFLAHLPQVQVQSGLNKETGTLEIHPNFEDLERYENLKLGSASDLLNATVAKMKDAFPVGDDSWIADDARVLNFARAHRGQNGAEDTYEADQPKLLYVTLRRSVEGLRVDGPGSRFTVAVAANGEILGAIYYWKNKARLKKAVAAPAPDAVKDEIIGQLKATYSQSNIVVRNVDVAYYDADQQQLQPVYRYVAEVMRSPRSVGRNDFAVGYVPFIKTSEVPAKLGGGSPAKTFKGTLPSSASPLPIRANPGVTIGRYVSFGDKAGFTRDAEAFWGELKTPNFVDEQHYSAERWMFTSRKDWFVNFVDLALVEVHGFPLGFMTYLDRGGETHVYRDLPLSGYGSASGGNLKHLIFHSCGVVPTGVDYFKSATKPWAHAWWDLFNGLSSVVGYRSSMFIDDGAGAAMASNIRRNQAIVPAWFGTVASLNVYGPGGWVDLTECTHNEPMGRASAIAVCKEGSKARVTDASSPRPDCLEAWWFSDELIPANGSTARASRSATPLPGVCPDQGGPKPPFPLSPPN